MYIKVHSFWMSTSLTNGLSFLVTPLKPLSDPFSTLKDHTLSLGDIFRYGTLLQIPPTGVS